jgi:hypothetical protein
MTDRILIVAEMRAGELLTALTDATLGKPQWRFKASALLRSIARYELPPLATEALREVDARKRAAEIMGDLCSND